MTDRDLKSVPGVREQRSRGQRQCSVKLEQESSTMSEHPPRIQEFTSCQGHQEECSPAAKMALGSLEKIQVGLILSKREMSELQGLPELQGRRGEGGAFPHRVCW